MNAILLRQFSQSRAVFPDPLRENCLVSIDRPSIITTRTSQGTHTTGEDALRNNRRECHQHRAYQIEQSPERIVHTKGNSADLTLVYLDGCLLFHSRLYSQICHMLILLTGWRMNETSPTSRLDSTIIPIG